MTNAQESLGWIRPACALGLRVSLLVFFQSMPPSAGNIARVRRSAAFRAAIHRRNRIKGSKTTGTVGLRYEFHADGRYKGAGAAQQYTVLNSTEVLRTTQAYFGDGSYSFDGNSIVLTGDDKRRSAHQFRLEKESKDGGKTRMDKMCLLDPGSTGEVCYQKQP